MLVAVLRLIILQHAEVRVSLAGGLVHEDLWGHREGWVVVG